MLCQLYIIVNIWTYLESMMRSITHDIEAGCTSYINWMLADFAMYPSWHKLQRVEELWNLPFVSNLLKCYKKVRAGFQIIPALCNRISNTCFSPEELYAQSRMKVLSLVWSIGFEPATYTYVQVWRTSFLLHFSFCLPVFFDHVFSRAQRVRIIIF